LPLPISVSSETASPRPLLRTDSARGEPIPPERRALEATEALHRAIELERVRSLYANAPIGVIAEFLAIAAIAGAMYGVASETRLVLWAGYMAACGMLRLFLWMQSRSATAFSVGPDRWESRYVMAMAASGLGWGATVPTFLPVENLLIEGIVALVISAVTVLAVDVLLASRRAATWFFAPALSIPALALAGYGGMVRLGTAVLMLAFLGVLIAVFGRRHAGYMAALTTPLQNAALLREIETANRGLREAQEDEQLVFDTALVGIAVIKDNRIARCNRKLEEIFGVRRGTLNGAATRLLYKHDAEYREACAEVDEALAQSGQYDVEREFQRRDGTPIWCRSRGQVIDTTDPSRGVIWMFEDLSEKRRVAEAIRRGEEALARAHDEVKAANVRLTDAIGILPDAFALYDAEDSLVMCNQRYADALPGQRSIESLHGRTYEEIVRMAVEAGAPVPVEYRRDLPGWVAELMRRHKSPGGEDFVYQSGDRRWYQLRERRTTDGGVVGVRSDITELKASEERIRHLANHDPLTGLPNRRLLEDRMAQAFNLARRHNHHVGVMLVDLDRFKVINDTKGHRVGDAVLQEVARRLRSTIRGADTVARQGGDEFVVVLPELRTAGDASRVAAKILNTLSRPIVVDGERFQINASIGIALFPLDGGDPDALLKQSDMAMYKAKGAGRGRFEFATMVPQQDELRFD
jgi:diguanylate cyclase (GGDEF)-like protein/PAS domain S-box-containing protein